MIHANSIEVYHSTVKDSLEVRQLAKVMRGLRELGGCATGRMISERTKIPPGQISRCMRQLEKKQLIRNTGKGKCEISKKSADYWQIISKQLKLF